MRLSTLQETRFTRLVPYLATALIALLVTLTQYQLFSPSAWSLPNDYFGDSLEALARLKAASEGDAMPFMPQVVERLGAPFGAHWNAYPTSDRLIMLTLGLIARVSDITVAANIGLVLAQISTALSCLWVLRRLSCRVEWAVSAALLFAFTYNSFNRGLPHFSFVFTWTIPLGIYAALLVMRSKRIRFRDADAWVCLLVAVVFGAQNPYYHFFWLLLMGFAVLLQLFGDRRRENLQLGLLLICISLLSLFLFNIEYWLYTAEPDALPLLVRNYGGTERYALKPVEMFIPPHLHRWEWFSFLGHRYLRWSEWRGEYFLPYVGLAGITGLLWLSSISMLRLSRKQPIPTAFLAICWLVGFCTIGGLTNVLAFFAGFQVFRATNRVAVFISCIILMFLALRLARVSIRFPRWLSFNLAAAVSVLCLLDQIPHRKTPQERDWLSKRVNSDKNFGREMEKALPKGAMVFQLPVLGFPEVKSPYDLTDYEHFRPYLHTDTLRFSYGFAKLRSRSQWQNELAELPLDKQLHELEALGFSALYFNKTGFKDRGQSLLEKLNTLGYTKRIQSSLGNQVLVLLNPSEEPKAPLAKGVTPGQGFYPLTIDGTHWAYEDATFSYYNPHRVPLEVQARFVLSSATPGMIEIELNKTSAAKTTYAGGPPREVELILSLRPGVNIFRLKSDAKAIRRSSNPYSLRKICLHAATIYDRSAPVHANSQNALSH